MKEGEARKEGKKEGPGTGKLERALRDWLLISLPELSPEGRYVYIVGVCACVFACAYAIVDVDVYVNVYVYGVVWYG